MKSFDFNAKSLHYRLAKTYGDLRTDFEWHYDERDVCTGYTETYDGNICDYTREIGRGIFKILIGIMCSLVLFTPMTFVLCYITACFTTGFFWPGKDDEVLYLGTIFWAIVLIVCGLGAWYKAHEMYREKYPKKYVPREVVEKEPGFMTLAYRRFKDKTCVRVTVK